MTRSKALHKINKWFAAKKWKPFDFQLEVWHSFEKKESGLIHASTGAGKTFAVWFGEIINFLSEDKEDLSPGKNTEESGRIIWITPLRALASDTLQTLEKTILDLDLNWTIQKRTGDVPQSQKVKQKKKLPTALIITPESLSLLLSYKNSPELFRNTRTVVVDEWHELTGSKRGVLTELCLARLRNWNSDLMTWGLSATLGNTNEAMETLLGAGREGNLVKGLIPRKLNIDSVIPEKISLVPWAGHLGIGLLNEAIKIIDNSESCLIFTNTRAQTELWYQSLLDSRPDYAGIIGIHHGSIDKDVRKIIEEYLRDGKLKAVVATSSLDLGVDFSPVDRVIQIGSPKGIARFLQRAGRSGHNPGRESRITFIPANAFEFVEIAAVKNAIAKGRIEPRGTIKLALDVLIQHAVTIALGTGFSPGDFYKEVKTTGAFKNLNETEWNWVLRFITKGGKSLNAYSDFHKVVFEDGQFKVISRAIAQRHRMSIGTIVSDAMMSVQFVKGVKLGNVEESFIAKMKPGDIFTFAGRNLEFVRSKEMTAYVRLAKKKKGTIPRWMGGRMPLSTELADEVREMLDAASRNIFDSPEMKAIKPILEIQNNRSKIPAAGKLLIEKFKSREGYDIFFFPFEGKFVHEGLASLFSFRISKIKPVTFSISTNDYGFELLSTQKIPLEEAIEAGLFSTENLTQDILQSLNYSEMARRQFREIARIAGLIFQGYPGSSKSVKQVQASSGLFFDVFKKYDPENLLLHQAEREVLERQLEQTRLFAALERLSREVIEIIEVKKPTPLGFPLLIDRLRQKFSSEKLADRIKRMELSPDFENPVKVKIIKKKKNN